MAEEAAINGLPTLSGELTVPMSWVWTAELQAPVDQTFSVGQLVTLEIAGLKRVGTVTRGSSPDLKTQIRLVGGAGKLDTVLAPSDYRGNTLAYLIGDVLKSAGEQVGDLSVFSVVSVPHWTRAKTTCGYSLRRLMRLAPDGTFLRVGLDGKWTGIQPTWASVGVYDDFRVDSYPSEDAIEINIVSDPTNAPEPGTAITVLSMPMELERVAYTWEPNSFRAVLWKFDPGPLDRIYAAMWKTQHLLQAQDADIDFRCIYQGKITADGGSPTAVFILDDLGRLTTLTNVTLLSRVGETVSIANGSRVTVGWIGGDERFPYALVGSWDNGGGLISSETTFSDHLSLIGPKVQLGATSGNQPAPMWGTFTGDFSGVLAEIQAIGAAVAIVTPSTIAMAAKLAVPPPLNVYKSNVVENK